METQFGKWLRDRGESHGAYAVRRKISSKPRVALLAGFSRTPQVINQLHYPSLTIISEDTGIPVEALIREAVEAAANPTPPRHYNRKAKDDGTRARTTKERCGSGGVETPERRG